MTAIRPFTLAIPEAELAALHARLDLTRWPERETVGDWTQGVPLAILRDLAAYWRTRYDWRACEARLNAHGQFITEIDGLDIHFLHVRSPEPGALPLLLTHGWPGSVIEFERAIGPLTNPRAHGAGEGALAFDVVIPSLPGYGFSAKPAQTGWGVQRIARAWGELMSRLGYSRWVAQGGDWGAFVTQHIGAQAPAGCLGIHLNMPSGSPTEAERANPTPAAAHAIERMAYYKRWDGGYSAQQASRPQTIGYSLVDSPVGLLGWILEKVQSWSDNTGAGGSAIDLLGADTILDNVMLYWLPATGASAARLYWESFGSAGKPPQVALPTGVSAFPAEILPCPRAWAERALTNIVQWRELRKGGHFAAWEQPELFVSELRDCFARMA